MAFFALNWYTYKFPRAFSGFEKDHKCAGEATLKAIHSHLLTRRLDPTSRDRLRANIDNALELGPIPCLKRAASETLHIRYIKLPYHYRR